MKGKITRLFNFAILSILLPCIYGCQGGGGLADLFGGGGLASVFGGGSSGSTGTIISGGGAIASIAGSSSIATIHNPEPATMLLLGTGLAAMAIHKNRKK